MFSKEDLLYCTSDIHIDVTMVDPNIPCYTVIFPCNTSYAPTIYIGKRGHVC